MQILKLDTQGVEMALIGKLLSENQSYWRISGLDAEDFNYTEHQLIFREIAAHIQAGREVNAGLLSTRFNESSELADVGGPKYLFECMIAASAIIDILTPVEKLRELNKARFIMDSLREATQRVEQNSSVDTMEIVILELMGKLMDATEEPMKLEDFDTVTRRVTRDTQEKLPCHATGIKALDEAMQGGMYAKRSYCIGARMKNGKTILLHTISQNLSDAGVPHLYIAAEMGADQIHQRNIARKIGTNSLAFMQGTRNPAFIGKLINYTANAKQCGFYADVPGISFDRLKQIVMLAVRRKSIKGFFLDYIGLVTGKPRHQSAAEFLEEVAAWIAGICKKEGIWCMYASQLNRDGDLRGSDGAIMAADQVYHLTLDKERKVAWMEQKASRYTPQMDVGSEQWPALKLDMKGPHFTDNNADYQEEPAIYSVQEKHQRTNSYADVF